MPPKKLSTGKSSLLESFLKYLIAAILVFVPLYLKFPLFNVPGTYVAVRVEDFLIAILGIFLVVTFPRYRQIYQSSVTIKAILVFLAVGLVSTLSGIFVTHTASPLLGLLHWARRIEYIVPFLGGLVLARRTQSLRFILEIIPLVALGVFAYGIAQIYYQAPVIITQNEEYAKGLALTLQPGVNLASTFAGHYDLATYLVMTLSILLSVYFALKNQLLKLGILVLSLMLFWIQLRTGSRIAFFALLASLSLVFIITKKPLWIIPLYLVGLIGLANTPSISGRFGNLLDIFHFQYLEQQVKGAFTTRSSILVRPAYAKEEIPPTPTPTIALRPIQQDRSTSIRVDVEWPRALRALRKNPLLGTGYSSISLATDNDYLRALGETGLLGSLSFLAVLISLFSEMVRGLRVKLSRLERQYLIGSLAFFFGFLLIATFIDVFEASKVAILFWLYLGIAVGLSTKTNHET